MSTKRPLPEGFFGDQINQKPKIQAGSQVSAEESIANVDEEWAKFQAESFYHQAPETDSNSQADSRLVIESAPELKSDAATRTATGESGDSEVESDHEDEDRLLDDLKAQRDFYEKVEKLKRKVQISGRSHNNTDSVKRAGGLVETSGSESSGSDSEDDLLWKKSIS